jgi:hypothetical protein
MVNAFVMPDGTLSLATKGALVLSPAIRTILDDRVNSEKILELLQFAHTVTLEVVDERIPQVEQNREIGVFLIQIVTLHNGDSHRRAPGSLLGAADLNAFTEQHKGLLSEAGIAYHPALPVAVTEVNRLLSELDCVTTINNVREGFVSKLGKTVPHPVQTLEMQYGSVEKLQSHLDALVVKKWVVRKELDMARLYVYSDAYNENTNRLEWDPVVAALARGSVFLDGRIVCASMPKFFSSHPECAAEEPHVQHKLKSKLYLQLTRTQLPTRAFLSKLIKNSKTAADLRQTLDSAEVMLDGRHILDNMLTELHRATKLSVDSATQLIEKHSRSKAEIAGDATVDNATKAVAFRLLKDADAETTFHCALQLVAKNFLSVNA